jgi:hypothetical protein
MHARKQCAQEPGDLQGVCASRPVREGERSIIRTCTFWRGRTAPLEFVTRRDWHFGKTEMARHRSAVCRARLEAEIPEDEEQGHSRINMLVELGIALYRSRVTNGSHLWRDYEISFVSRRGYDGPEMLESYRVVKRKVPEPRRNVGGRSVFDLPFQGHHGCGTDGVPKANRAPSQQEVPLQSIRASLRKLRSNSVTGHYRQSLPGAMMKKQRAAMVTKEFFSRSRRRPKTVLLWE